MSQWGMDVYENLYMTMLLKTPSRQLASMAETGLLGEIFPELQAVIDFRTRKPSKHLWKHILKVVDQTPPVAELRWAALFHDVGKPAVVKEGRKITFYGHEAVSAKIWEGVAKRMKVGFPFYVRVGAIIVESAHFVALIDNTNVAVTDGAVNRFIASVGEENIENIYQFAMADMTTANEVKERRMKASLTALKERIDTLIYIEANRPPKLAKGFGNILMEKFGLEGRELGKVMDEFTRQLVNGECTMDEIMEDLFNWDGKMFS